MTPRPSGRPPRRRHPSAAHGVATALIFLLAACAPPEDQAPVASPVASADSPALSPDPNAAIVDRWRRALPPETLVRQRACPFECCIYGEWEAESEIRLLSSRDADASEAGSLASGTTFLADSGLVEITGVAILAVADTIEDAGGGRTLLPGDTLVVLDYVGEGFFNVWHRGQVFEVTGFWGAEQANPRAELIGRYAAEWWVHAVGPAGRSGWFRADRPEVRFSGADACRGPRAD